MCDQVEWRGVSASRSSARGTETSNRRRTDRCRGLEGLMVVVWERKREKEGEGDGSMTR